MKKRILPIIKGACLSIMLLSTSNAMAGNYYVYAASGLDTYEGTVTGCAFNSNTSTNGAAIYVGACAGLITINNTNFTSNIATGYGGAYWEGNTTGGVSITNSCFCSNTASSQIAGAVYI